MGLMEGVALLGFRLGVGHLWGTPSYILSGDREEGEERNACVQAPLGLP